MTTELSVYSSTPNAVDLIKFMGESIARSQLCGCQNEYQGNVLAMTCLAKNYDPMSIAERYDIIQGRLSKKADAILAEFRSLRGGRHKVIERTSEAAEIELRIEGEVERFRLTWEEAQLEPFTKGKNGQVKDNYATPRKRMQMLWARVVSDGVRAVAPEVIAGYYTPEEIDDMDNDGGIPTAVVTASPASTPPSGSSDQTPEAEDAEYVVTEHVPDPNLATGEQIARIRELFKVLNVPADKQLAAFNKRNAADMSALTIDGATDLIAALEDGLARRQAAAAEANTPPFDTAPAEQPPAPNEAMEGPTNGPATNLQVAKALKLFEHVVQQEGFSWVAAEMRKKFDAAGLQKFEQLTRLEIDALIDGLEKLNLEAFFASSIRGHVAAGK